MLYKTEPHVLTLSLKYTHHFIRTDQIVGHVPRPRHVKQIYVILRVIRSDLQAVTGEYHARDICTVVRSNTWAVQQLRSERHTFDEAAVTVIRPRIEKRDVALPMLSISERGAKHLTGGKNSSDFLPHCQHDILVTANEVAAI